MTTVDIRPDDRPRTALGRAWKGGLGYTSGFVVALIGIIASFTMEMSREMSGTLAIVVMLGLLMAGVTIAYAMILSGILGMAAMGGVRTAEQTVSVSAYTSLASWSLSVIPMFIFMGIALWKSGLTTKAYESAKQWLGRLPGGLAITTNFAGAGLAAASGSTIGISFALGRVAIPEMLRAKYEPRLATGVVCMAGTLGQLIPPSVLLIIYAGIAAVPVGPLLLASTVPGVTLAVLYGGLILIMAIAKPSLAPRVDTVGVTWASRFRSLIPVSPIFLVIGTIVIGLFTGWFTPTEAGAIGAAGAVLAGVLSNKAHRSARGFAKFLGESAAETVRTSAALFLLLIAVDVFNRALAMSGLTQALTEAIKNAGLNRVSLLLVLIVVYLLLGMFLEPLPIMLLTVPPLTAALTATGVDMIWFGVFLVILCEAAIVSPPIGLLVFVVHRIAQRRDVSLGRVISLNDVYMGVVPFVAITMVFLVFMILFPGYAMWLPGISAGGP